MRHCNLTRGLRSLPTLLVVLSLWACGGSALGPPSGPIPDPPVAPTTTPPTPTPTASPVPARAFLFVTSTTDLFRDLYSYEIDAETGALSFKEARPFSGGDLTLAAHPSGRFLFRGYFEGNGPYDYDYSLRTYAVAPDGALADTRLVSTFSGGAGTVTQTTSADGFLYVHWIDFPPDSIDVWRVDQGSGELSSRTGFAGSAPPSYGGFGRVARFALSPRGTFLYLTRRDGVEFYRIGSSGAGVDREPLPLPGSGGALVVRPDGQFLYVISNDQEARTSPWRMSVFALDERGRPRPVSAIPVSARSSELTFDPLGRFLFLTREGGIDVYSVDPTRGLLTLAHRTEVGNLVSVVVEPRGRFLYVSRTDGALWGYSIDPTRGALRDLGHVGEGEGPMVTVNRQAAD